MAKNPPTVAELFGLNDVEGIRQRQEDHALFYLFGLHGLLPSGQMLAIDVISGVTRVCTAGSEQTIVAETRLSQIETCLFTALLISHPYAVATYQVRALSQLHEGVEVKGERACAVQEDGDDTLFRDVITACNLKLKPLALAITPIDHETHYRLTPVR
jgi:hypothetical protein